MRLVPLAALLAVATLPSAAHADGVAITQNDFSSDGQPVLVANFSPDGSLATPSWKRCLTDCGETVATGQRYAAGETAPGTAFEATTVFGGATTTARSKTWTGRVSNLSPPTISGDARVGGTVTAAAGTWSGGWGDDRSELRIRLCKSAEPGTPCVTLAPGPASAVLDSAYAGWYVGAIDSRYAKDAVFPAGAWATPIPGEPSRIPAPEPQRTVAHSALIGPIAAAPTLDLTDQGGGQTPPISEKPLSFTPKVKVYATAKKVEKVRTLGTVSCQDTCFASIAFTQGKKTVQVQRTIKGTKALTLPSKLNPKRSVRVTVSVMRSSVTKSATVKPAR